MPTIFEDAWDWWVDQVGVGLELAPYDIQYGTEGSDYAVYNLAEHSLYTWNDVDMKGGDDTLTIQFNDYFTMGVYPGRMDGGEGTDTMRLAVDNDRGLKLDFAFTNLGMVHTATIVGKPYEAPWSYAFKIVNFEKFDILSSSQNDLIRTYVFDDKVNSGGGHDTIETFAGNDQIAAGEGNDSVAAGYGDDIVYGNEGNDTIYGSIATVSGGSWGHDEIYGGTGNDTIYDRDGRDVIYGGRGSDHIIVDGNVGDFFSGGLASSEKKSVTVNGATAYFWNNDVLSKDVLNVELEEKSNPFIAEGWLFDATSGVARDLRPGEIGSFRFEGFEELVVNGTAQNDKIILGAGADTANGNNGIDVLIGLGGVDTLRGGNGGDSLYGGLGADNLVGGAGNDTFVFNTALGAGEIDRIYDFEVPNDTIMLNNSVFRALSDGALAAGGFVTGSRALQADDRIIYNKTTGDISYDADGSGAAAAILFAKVNAGLALTAADFLII
jgi:Ca2+-binding RTX toxin-like protein